LYIVDIVINFWGQVIIIMIWKLLCGERNLIGGWVVCSRVNNGAILISKLGGSIHDYYSHYFIGPFHWQATRLTHTWHGNRFGTVSILIPVITCYRFFLAQIMHRKVSVGTLGGRLCWQRRMETYLIQ